MKKVITETFRTFEQMQKRMKSSANGFSKATRKGEDTVFRFCKLKLSALSKVIIAVGDEIRQSMIFVLRVHKFYLSFQFFYFYVREGKTK